VSQVARCLDQATQSHVISVLIKTSEKGEHRLRVSENRVQRRICSPKGEEVAGGWRRPRN